MLVILTNIPTPYRTAFFNILNKELTQQNIKFHVVYCAKTEPRRFWEFKDSEQEYPYTFLKGVHPSFKGFYPHINSKVYKTLKNLNPTYLLLAGSWNTPTILYALLLKNKLKTKTIFWSEGHASAEKVKNTYFKKFKSKIYKKFDAFVVPNNKSKKYITDLLDEKAIIGFLPNTINEDYFNRAEVTIPSQLPSKYGILKDDICVVLVSTLSERKGVLEFLNAYVLLDEVKRSKISLVFIGEGELMPRLIDVKTTHNLSKVHIIGQAKQEVVREFLSIADVFALPTKLDPNPLTPIEASFMEKALMLSKYAGNFDELLNDKTGIAIDEITEEEIHKSLIKLLDYSKEDLKNMGLESYKNVKNNFSRKQASLNLIDFLTTKI